MFEPTYTTDDLDRALRGEGVSAFPVVLRALPAGGADGERAADAAELTRLLAGVALDASIFDERAPFFFRATISTSQLDSYYTRMHRSSLRRFAAAAKAGVALQNSHRWRELPIGRSLTGTYTQADDGGQTEADFYTIPGLVPNGAAGLTSDQLIDGLRAGIFFDTSVGFHGGRWVCSICGNDMLRSWDCMHIPGFEYEVKGKGKNAAASMVVAEASIEEANLSEVSIVYDGATPGAAVTKAYREAQAGRLPAEKAALLEARYRIALPGTARVWAGATPTPQPTSSAAPAPDTQPEPPPARAESDAAPEGAGQQEERMDIRELLTRLSAPEGAEVEWIEQEFGRLRALADDGRAYRADLVQQAIESGVRALGATFAVETYQRLLETLPLDQIKRMRDDWETIARATLVGGRLTVDAETPPAATETSQAGAASIPVPAAAFKMSG